MDGIDNYCFHFSRSQGMSYLRASGGNYDTMFILRRILPSSWPSVATQRVIWMMIQVSD